METRKLFSVLAIKTLLSGETEKGFSVVAHTFILCLTMNHFSHWSSVCLYFWATTHLHTISFLASKFFPSFFPQNCRCRPFFARYFRKWYDAIIYMYIQQHYLLFNVKRLDLSYGNFLSFYELLHECENFIPLVEFWIWFELKMLNGWNSRLSNTKWCSF